MTNRSRFEITYHILKTIKPEGSRISQLLYTANVSFEMLKDLLKRLESERFIERTVFESGKRILVKRTEKADRFLLSARQMLVVAPAFLSFHENPFYRFDDTVITASSEEP